MNEHYRYYIKIGLNHYLLYNKFTSSPDGHERTLQKVLSDERLEVLDIWIRGEEPYRTNEIKAVLASNKEIYYNVGTRKGKEAAHPAALDKRKRAYSLDFYKAEIDRGLEAGCKKVVTNSGHDIPENRESAFEALVDFYCEICEFVGAEVLIMIEPTDRTVDKKKFIGPSREAVVLAQRIHNAGYSNFSSMVDMCHIPLMGETIEQAMFDTIHYLGHIHLGNCILNKDHPLYGDKHPPWGIKGSEYGIDEVSKILHLGLSSGYFNKHSRGSASFEMRPVPGMNEEESLDSFFKVLSEAWKRA